MNQAILDALEKYDIYQTAWENSKTDEVERFDLDDLIEVLGKNIDSLHGHFDEVFDWKVDFLDFIQQDATVLPQLNYDDYKWAIEETQAYGIDDWQDVLAPPKPETMAQMFNNGDISLKWLIREDYRQQVKIQMLDEDGLNTVLEALNSAHEYSEIKSLHNEFLKRISDAPRSDELNDILCKLCIEQFSHIEKCYNHKQGTSALMEIDITRFVDSEYWLKKDRHSFEKLFLDFYSKPEFGLPHSKWERSMDTYSIEGNQMIQMRFARDELATLANNLSVEKLNEELFHPFLKHLFESQIIDFSSKNIIHHSLIERLPDIPYFKQLVLENKDFIHEKLQLLDNFVCLSYININSNRQFIGKLVNILDERFTISLDAQHDNMIWRDGKKIATKLFELMGSSTLIYVGKLDLINEGGGDEPDTPNGKRVCLFFHHFNTLLSQTSKENARSIETRMKNSIPQSTLMCATKLKLANMLNDDELSLCYDLLDTPQTPNTNRKMKI